MRSEHAHLLACPDCRSSLALHGAVDTSGRVAEGSLRCEACRVSYPVTGGIPRFVSSDNYARGFGLQWNLHRQTQYDSYTGVPVSETRFFEESRWDRDLQGHVVLEVGSGSGRFTEHAVATGATVISVEYSAAVEANYATNGQQQNLLLIQGDLYRLPLPLACCDRLFCFGVLQHTPDVERSFKALPQYLQSGGKLAADVYRKPLGWRRLTNTKYWVRPMTRGMKPERLYGMVKGYVRLMWPVSRLISAIPRVGKKINWSLLIADYRGVYPLPEPVLKEWAILETFDMLGPAFDDPQTLETFRRWFEEAGLIDIEVHYGYNGVEGRAVKP